MSLVHIDQLKDMFSLLYTGHIDSGHYDVLLPITKKNDNG
jgi:hypothetical protein